MEWWLLAFIKIMIINIILSGDNAIVIAMASRNLPTTQRKLAIFWGAFGAVLLRILLTIVAIQLLQIPYLMAVGGILLVWIAMKLLIDENEPDHIRSADNLGKVVMTIIIADFVMSLDNVIAITAVAKGDLLLITIGLIISIPLIIWGSGIILKLLERYPALIYIGAAILGYTAGEMILADTHVMSLVPVVQSWPHWIIPIMLALKVMSIGWFSKKIHVYI